MMKTRHFAFCLLAVSTLMLSACATSSTTTATTTAETDQTKKRVHTREELRKTGESETGPALEKVDPAVRTSGPR
jgi:outer membrane biogenesis lipoprotein LolB